MSGVEAECLLKLKVKVMFTSLEILRTKDFYFCY